MTQRPRRRSPRPSFVVTSSVVTTAFSAIVVLAACGGQVGDNSAAGDGGPDGTLTTCPKVAPAEGAACGGTLTCDYSSCGPSGGSGSSYECQSGKMVKFGGSSCNPPAPECPPTEPTVGSSCLGGSWGSCNYRDTCEHRPVEARPTQYICGGGTWRLAAATEPSYVATCPTTVPTHDSPCTCGPTHFYGNCTYGDCYGMPTTQAYCDATTGKWNVTLFTCNPPALDAGAGG